MSKKLEGKDLEYANDFLVKFGESILKEVGAEANSILLDLKTGALHTNNFEPYMEKSSDCAKLLLRIVIENMQAYAEEQKKKTASDENTD